MNDDRAIVLGWPALDGTFRARIFQGMVKAWECSHEHRTIEDAWSCGELEAKKIVSHDPNGQEEK